jgi:AbrB family looped-hinge helix DNA binding protein
MEARMKAIVAERGQVTIPKTLRDKLGIRPGTTLEFVAKDGALLARKAETDPVSQVFGCLGGRIDTDKFIRALRGPAAK